MVPRSIQILSLPETAHLPAYRHHHTKCRKPRTWETNLSVCPKQCHQNGPHIREIFFAATAYKGHFSPLETQDNPFAAKFFWIVCRTVSTVYPYCWICSLPTDWESEVFCFRALLCLLPFDGPHYLALLCPLFTPARFPVWVSVWVSKNGSSQNLHYNKQSAIFYS